MNSIRRFLVVALMTFGLVIASNMAGAEAWTVDDLAAALTGPDRSDADKARDAGRKPADVVVFGGIEPGMLVLDVMASGGWYTEVLSIAAGPEGTVYSHNEQSALESRGGANLRALNERLADDRLANVMRAIGALGELDIEPGSIDAALTALNFHDTFNFTGRDAATEFLRDIYRYLKPGGVLVMIDHIGNSGGDNTKLHRIPKQDVMELISGTGFVVEADSELLSNPDDDRTQMVFGKGMRGNTDRFLLKLRKPAG
ncbi:MAG: methyltransferase domain-containing protein [Gammaproteobacteria bacterium]|nr:MAG: methyltransferase domain-containing protein [Gammaproteobacteria bacterium]